MAVFGASGGIGTELVRQLRAAGAPVMAVGRNEEALQALAAETGCHHTVADATTAAGAQAGIAAAKQEFGAVAGAVNLLGSILLKPAHLITEAEWADTLRINLTSAFNVLRATVKAVEQDAAANIVLMSSVAGVTGLPNHEAIAAAKAGVAGLTASAAATYAPRNIRVNAIAPGLVQTPLTEKIMGNEASAKASIAMHPLGRVGEPRDIVAALMWLLDPATHWVTGQVVSVDGGMSRVRPRPGA